MRTEIHPEYTTTRVHCNSCNTEFETRSTAGDAITVDICSNCHPFYTGTQRIVDTGGRVQRFRNRLNRQQENR